MPRLFVPPEQLAGDRVVLEGEAHHYLGKVLRLRAGDAVVVFDGCGTEIEARLVALEPRSAELALGPRRTVAPPAAAITLLAVVPRGERMDLVIQKTTELGVARIVPVLAGRSVARPGPDRRRRWLTIAQEAARQSGRADLPAIDEPRQLAHALADAQLPAARLVLWEGERARPLRRALDGGPRAVGLLVGPEGGFSAPEIALAEAHGFLPVGVGPRILRAETAAIVAVALAQSAAGGLD